MRPILFFCLSICFTIVALGQKDMSAGFTLLENGDFQEAEVFFEKILEGDPENKTAKLCYGRAVGLSGEPGKATEVFKMLLDQYPGDLEITLNYYESYLWAKAYEKALPLYQELSKAYPENFNAQLGLANTLSNLGKYPEALEVIQNALVIQPDNNSAKVSKKYMHLGYANQLANAEAFGQAEAELQKVLLLFPEDQEAYRNLANLYLRWKAFPKAREMYWRTVKRPEDSIAALQGVSLSWHLEGQERKALVFAEKALDQLNESSSYEDREGSENRWVQALIWNGKYKKARKQIEKLSENYGERDWILGLRAMLGMYTARFNQSVQNYNTLKARDSSSFDANLGGANAYLAQDKPLEAYRSVTKTLDFYNNQKDALALKEKIDGKYIPLLKQEAGYTVDNGDNKAYFSNTSLTFPLALKWKVAALYNYRITDNAVLGNQADMHTLGASMEYKLMPNTYLKGQLGLTNAQGTQSRYTLPTYRAVLKMKPFLKQDISLGVNRSLQAFNAALIEEEIALNQYFGTYHLATNFGLGWYTQYTHTRQSDDNRSDLLYTSLYYQPFRSSILKIGLSYQQLEFAQQRPLIYFSPEFYRAGELFGESQWEPAEDWKLSGLIATGLQQIEEQESTATFRGEIALTYDWTDRINLRAYGKYSSLAAATAAGFEFTQIGLELQWKVSRKPRVNLTALAQK